MAKKRNTGRDTAPADAVDVKSIDALTDLVFDDRNANKGTERGSGLIENSLRNYGAGRSVLADRHGVLIAGNKTVQGAIDAGIEKVRVIKTDGNELVVVQRTDLDLATDKAARELAIVDNRAGQLSLEWDAAVLSDLAETMDVDLAAVGFSEKEIESMQPDVTPADVRQDDVPGADEVPTRSAIGDLWRLGDHLLLCGDSTIESCVRRVVADGEADMMFTDPPYGVDYVGKTSDALKIQNDKATDLPALLDGAFAGAMLATKPGAAWYVACPGSPLNLEFGNRLAALGVLRQQLIWVKDTLVVGRSDYHYRHEPIYYGWKPGAAHHELPDRKQDTVWEIPRPKANKEHPTMKPVELVARAIFNSSDKGQIVYEPFGGSGTTLIAAEQLSRRCRTIELSPKYCDVIIARWEAHTGQKAEKVAQ